MLNKVILHGRLVADPELRQTQSGIVYCNFTVAINRAYKGSDAEKQTDFIKCQAWRQTAEFINRYFSKGSLIIVEGSLQNNNYTDSSGVKHYTFVVNANSASFGGSKADNSSTAAANEQLNPVQTALPSEQPGIGDISDFEEILSDGEVPF